MKLLSKPLPPLGLSPASIEAMSLKRLAKESGISRHTLMYRVNTMKLSKTEAVSHQKNKWVNYPETKEAWYGRRRHSKGNPEASSI